jgi:outer membrane protein assembly factor BamB
MNALIPIQDFCHLAFDFLKSTAQRFRQDLKVRIQPRFLGLLVWLFMGNSLGALPAQDWPHWRGPNRDDKSSETGLLQTWPEGGPKRIWLNEHAGKGYAGLAVVDDRLYTMGLEDDSEFAICLNASTGEEIWRQNLGNAFREGHGDGPRSTPSIDDEHLYVMAAMGTLACLKVENGEIVWQTRMQDYGGKLPTWGFAESPLVDGDLVVCTPGGQTGTLLALNKLTGEKVWQSAAVVTEVDGSVTPPADAHYSSILPITWNGQRQYVQLTVLAVIGVDAKDGTVLWKSEWPGRIAVIPSPIFDSGQVYVSSGYGIGSKLIELKDDHTVAELWFTKTIMNHHGGVILVDDHFYGSSDRGGFVCQDREEGKMKWGNRKIGKGAVIYADGLFYHVQENDGKVFLFSASPEGSSLKGSFVLEPQSAERKKGKVWVHPIIANGRLYLRDQNYIYCFDIKLSITQNPE